MEFIQKKKFLHPQLSFKRKIRVEETLKISCYYYVSPQAEPALASKLATARQENGNSDAALGNTALSGGQSRSGINPGGKGDKRAPLREEVIYAGMTDGSIVTWKRKNYDQSSLLAGKEYEFAEVISKKPHKGEVKTILFETINGKDLVLTGSADRTIKVWDMDVKIKEKDPCIQTLIGHGGSVISTKYSSQIDVLVSCSTDKTIKLWKPDSGRELLYYPWFICIQTIKDFQSVSGFNALENPIWISSLEFKEGESLALFAGDSEGSMVILRPKDSWREGGQFELWKKNPQVHRLGITQLLLVIQENFVFTISYDQCLRGFDAANGGEFLCIKNPNKCLYTSLFWDETSQELLVADEAGYIGVLNVYVENPIAWEQIIEQKIVKIEMVRQDLLLIASEASIFVYRIKKGTRNQDMMGHTGAILQLLTLDPVKLVGQNQNEKPRVVSASMDNTIRLWDSGEMTTLNVLESPENSEVTCMEFLESPCLLATGHEDGVIRLWNLEIATNIVLKTEDPKLMHSNTITAIKAACFKDCEFLLSTGYDGRVSIWEISEKVPIATSVMMSNSVCLRISFKAQPNVDKYSRHVDPHGELGHEVLCLEYNPKNSTIITGGNTNEINIWKMMENGELVATLRGHEDAVTCMVLDQNYLFSGSDDKTIRVWNTFLHYELYVLPQYHEEPIRAIMMLPDSGFLVSCAGDNKILIWSYQEQEVVQTIERKNLYRCLGYVSAFDMLLVGTEECSIMTFNLSNLADERIPRKEQFEGGEENGEEYGPSYDQYEGEMAGDGPQRKKKTEAKALLDKPDGSKNDLEDLSVLLEAEEEEDDEILKKIMK